MGKSFSVITPEIGEWIGKQKVFFVATAPLAGSGHVNCSPKGLDSFRIISPNQVAYQDLTGSGIETIAHVQENKRITILFCAFDGPPKIFRLYGEGEIVFPESEKFEELATHFIPKKGVRAIVVVNLELVSDSCGYGVPLYEFKAERDVLTKWADVKGEEGARKYQQIENLKSIDGLAGLPQSN